MNTLAVQVPLEQSESAFRNEKKSTVFETTKQQQIKT
jgi:hypothetical protein